MTKPTTTLEEFKKSLKEKKVKKKEKRYFLSYELTFNKIKKYLKIKGTHQAKQHRPLPASQYAKCVAMTLEDRMDVELLMNRILYFSYQFDKLKIINNSLKWDIHFYGIAMTFLNELMDEILEKQTRKAFVVIDFNDKGIENNE